MPWKRRLQSPWQQAGRSSFPPTPSHTQPCASISIPPRCGPLQVLHSVLTVCVAPQFSFQLPSLWLACHCDCHNRRAGRTIGLPCPAKGLLIFFIHLQSTTCHLPVTVAVPASRHQFGVPHLLYCDSCSTSIYLVTICLVLLFSPIAMLNDLSKS